MYVAAALLFSGSFWSNSGAWKLSSLRELALVLGLVAAGACFRAGRFYYFGKRLGWTVPVWPSAVAFFASFAFTATPGKVGELVKSALLRSEFGVPVAQSAGVLLVERLGDLLALLSFAFVGVSLFVGMRIKVYLLIATLIVLSLCIAPGTIGAPVLRWALRFSRVRPLVERLLRLAHAVNTLLRPKPLLIGFSFALIGWGGEVLAFNILAQHGPAAVPLIDSIAIVGLSAVIGALSMLPGGVGGVEATMGFLLVRLGFDLSSATATVIVFRLCTLYFGTLAGFCFLGVWNVALKSKNTGNGDREPTSIDAGRVELSNRIS
jgi:uncharacterized protein (TIRG00374 family)